MSGYLKVVAGIALGLAAAAPAAAQGVNQGMFQNKVVVPPGDVTVSRPSTKIIAPGANPVPISPYSYPAYSAYRYANPVIPGAPAQAPTPPSVQGYWIQQWVPQYTTYTVWVPGYFDDNGLWIEGHYQAQVAQTGGFYQNVWVPGN